MASESPNRTPNGFVVFLGSAAAFVVVAAVFAGALAANKPVEDVEQKRAAQRFETLKKIETEAQERLNSVGWSDKAKGTAHVSISDAMTMVVGELSAKKPAPSSVKVEPPLPMPVADPASKEPPPAALTSAPQGADTIRFTPPAATPAPAAPAPVPVPANAPPSPPEKAPDPAPAAPAPATPAAPVIPPGPVPAIPPAAPDQPEAPARPPLINPVENPAPPK